MSKRIKQLEVAALTRQIEAADNCVLLGYKGLSAQGAVELRQRLRANNVDFRIFKNSLARQAFREAKRESLEQFLDGETAIAFGEDPVSAPKTLADWRKENKVLELRGGLVEGKAVDAEQIEAVAKIPSREVLLSRLLGSIQSPATGLVTVLTGLQRNLVYGLKALADKKEAEGG